MSADSNLNLGGNADFIRPKYNFIMLGAFFIIRSARLAASTPVAYLNKKCPVSDLSVLFLHE